MANYEVKFGVNSNFSESCIIQANSESEARAKWENSHYNNGRNRIGRIIKR